MSKPLLIGLTGGIGSGKSTVAKIFKSLAVPVFNSDVEAKKIINNNTKVIEAITSVYGSVYTDNGLDTKKMATIVFNDAKALEKLNAIIHPEVKIAFENWVIRNSTEKILIKEAAILFETGIYKELDKTILVVSPKELRIKRVMSRDGVDETGVIQRMEAQLPDDKKKTLADFIISNDDKQLLIPQILSLITKLKA